uniref:ARAD1D46398p n=1 Tax=Blastobotrys adeninivorans TaxID=409370 RepID=A0A060TDS4_BLAAD
MEMPPSAEDSRHHDPLYRSTSEASVSSQDYPPVIPRPARPSSRGSGINFSRPSTFYKLDSPSSERSLDELKFQQQQSIRPISMAPGELTPPPRNSSLSMNRRSRQDTGGSADFSHTPVALPQPPPPVAGGPPPPHGSSSVAAPAPSTTSSEGSKKQAKRCRLCGEPILGQYVRALGSIYHIDCFVCADCGEPCSAKFFPVDATDPEMLAKGIVQVPLCERDYFRRLGLLCYECDGALRGSYITALGRKYHVEHFRCSICDFVFGPEDSYYEHNDQIFCHFHYSTMYASKCEGCQTAMLKQFVETFRSGREQRWHPECYMIFKFWNVKLCPEGVPPSLNPLRPLSVTASLPIDQLDRRTVARHEHEVEKKVFRIWTVLCGYEEATAAYISDMLQTASSGKFNQSLAATAKLVMKIEVLFSAVDNLVGLIGPLIRRQEEAMARFAESEGDEAAGAEIEFTYTKLGKEAKTLCKKVVGFMSLISKSREKGVKRMGITSDLLNLVTSLAHYLKLLIRYGLSNSLAFDREHLDGNAVDSLLDIIMAHDKTPSNPLANLGVSAMTTDACCTCDKSIEDSCARLGERRWHIACLECSNCHRALSTPQDLPDARWNTQEKRVFCSQCAPSDSRSGFVFVTKLTQFVFLLKIAVARLQLVLDAFDSRDRKAASQGSSREAASSGSTKPPLVDRGSDFQNEREYNSTVTDVRRLRSTRLNQHVSESAHSVRRSRILDLPDSHHGQMRQSDRQGLPTTPPATTPPSADFTGKITIQEESSQEPEHKLDGTSDLFKNEKSLTLDDIPRIVAAEQAREQRPNAFKHHQPGGGAVNAMPRTKQVQQGQKKYIGELTDSELVLLRHIAILLIEKMLSDWFTLEELLEFIDVRKAPSLWEKFGKAFGGGSDKRQRKKVTGVFGVPLDALVDKHGVDSTLGVGPTPLRIPTFIDDCISSMRQKDMSVEGIFRKNGNIRRLKEFSEKIDKNPDKGGILSEENAVQLAALLKKYLRELPEPLMTSRLLKLWISAQKFSDYESKKRLLHLVCLLLPRTHRDVMEVLLFFLNWTASFSHIDEETGSKMDTHNLSTVITPNILYQKANNGQPGGQRDESGDAYFLSIESVNILIQEQSEMAEVPDDLWAILHSVTASTTSPNGVNELVSKPTRDLLSYLEPYVKNNVKGPAPSQAGSSGSGPSAMTAITAPVTTAPETATLSAVSNAPVSANPEDTK